MFTELVKNIATEVANSRQLEGTLPRDSSVKPEQNLDGTLPMADEKLQSGRLDGELPKPLVEQEPEHLRTINSALEGSQHPVTEVPYSRKEIMLPEGKEVQGVFPEFSSQYDVQMPEDYYLKSDREQFEFCTESLHDEIKKNPELGAKFDEVQLEQIENGDTPDGYIWHHNEQPGKMQLVDEFSHSKSAHTGGRSIWGGGSEMRGGYQGGQPV